MSSPERASTLKRGNTGASKIKKRVTIDDDHFMGAEEKAHGITLSPNRRNKLLVDDDFTSKIIDVDLSYAKSMN